ncbi:MAG: N-acetyl sugar amidotransferase [Chloroflexota bacterium]|nr:N-acetyl sugar amidotransferase [Chloroflexota bacterium]
MKYCKKCVMPDTRPGSLFDEEGVCQACRNYEKQGNIDWGARFKELRSLCEKHRREDGYYDCVVAVSGGKDSHFLTYMMKERMGMNPLLVCVADPFTHTVAGTHNLGNLAESFNCDVIVFNMSTDLFRRVTRIGFEELGEPLRFIEAAIYTVPPKYAVAFNIPLIVYGENAAYTYGTTTKDSCSAQKYIAAGHSAAGEKLGDEITDFWCERGILMKEMNAIAPPSQEDLERVKPEPVFMSYFVPWDDEKNYQIAKRYGFRDLHHEWQREGFIEDYGQIDSLAYIVHLWMKYPKFGFARATDITCRWIRKGKITREEAKRLLMEHDHKLDQRAMEDFIAFMGYRPRQFWDIVEQFWNPELFENVDGVWRLKNPVYSDLVKGH